MLFRPNFYGREFFNRQKGGSEATARLVLPQILRLIKPRSIVDFGCGAGGWLKVAIENGVDDVLGLDGGEGTIDSLMFPADRFRSIDFEEPLPDLGRRFDLAVSLEVLEHITPLASVEAIKWLCHSASATLFSAAIPGQEGRGHVNEKWLSEWSAMFAESGLQTFDVIRPIIWKDERIPSFYRQNIVLMADGAFGQSRGLTPAVSTFMDFVHPAVFAGKQKWYRRSLEARAKRIRDDFIGWRRARRRQKSRYPHQPT